MPMNGVSTGHFMTGGTGRKQILLTNGTVGHVLARLAIVIVKQKGINAHAAVVAVPKVFLAANPTKTTISAVVRILIVRHPKIADVTMVFSELNFAFNAIVAVWMSSSINNFRPKIQNEIERNRMGTNQNQRSAK